MSKTLGKSGEGASEKGEGAERKGIASPQLPMLLIFCTLSQFRSLRVSFWIETPASQATHQGEDVLDFLSFAMRSLSQFTASEFVGFVQVNNLKQTDSYSLCTGSACIYILQFLGSCYVDSL